ILQYARNKKFFEKHKPCSLRPQGKEIIRTWLYYTLLKNYLLNKDCIFKDVWINYHVVDEKGRKMSKSLGNVIDPEEVIKRFGAEPLRLWAALEGNITSGDFRCSMERISAAAKTVTKLWNIARFVSMFPEKKKAELCEIDKAILDSLNSLIRFCDERYNSYDFHNPAVKLRRFLWETFASNYLEIVKPRAYNSQNSFSKKEQESAFYTMHLCLRTLLLLLSPIIPFVTSHLYEKIYSGKIYKEKFPQPIEHEKSKIKFDQIEELNRSIWKFKKDKGLSLKDGILKARLPEIFKYAEKDIKAAHNISEIVYGDSFEVIDV
ncbi:MAG: valine--tRNA ligase, partial [Candidatus Iainarchaeum archaeon]